jgi:hypothetical protein
MKGANEKRKDSFGGFESKTGPGFFFFSHPCLQVQYQGIDTI